MDEKFKQDVQTVLQHGLAVLSNPNVTLNGMSGADIDGMATFKNLIRMMLSGELQIVNPAEDSSKVEE